VAKGTNGAPNDTALDIPVTLEMLSAGVLAYQQWNPDEEEIECLVAEVFYSMIEKSTLIPILPAEDP
jgi:hypothetical protein